MGSESKRLGFIRDTFEKMYRQQTGRCFVIITLICYYGIGVVKTEMMFLKCIIIDDRLRVELMGVFVI
jgi:hypothetical protein